MRVRFFGSWGKVCVYWLRAVAKTEVSISTFMSMGFTV